MLKVAFVVKRGSARGLASLTLLITGIICGYMPSYPPPSPTDKQVLLAQMLALGEDHKVIADTLNLPLSYIKLMLKSSLFLTKVKEEQDRFINGKRMAAEKRLAEVWDKAIGNLERLMDHSEDERVILQAASKILEKGPIFEKAKVVEKRELKVSFTPTQEKLVEAVLVEDDASETED